MGFKVDTSFLRFVTMGATAALKVMAKMTEAGLCPIELERYSTSNKIWESKVKRLRLPDLLCVRTGLRIEVRAKSKLAIKMSDAPGNPARRWSSGLNPSDLVAFVHCQDVSGRVVPSDTVELFWVKDIDRCPEAQTKLGPPKSASEGSERDREWPTIVAGQGGCVVSIANSKIKTLLNSGRPQTYHLRNMYPYLRVGERFEANSQFIAGLPQRKVSLAALLPRGKWDPRSLLNGDSVDRYVAAKALSVLGRRSDFPALRRLMNDDDARVALEAAGTLAKLGDQNGIDQLIASVSSPREKYLRIEAVFLLSEMSKSILKDQAERALLNIVSNQNDEQDEAKQAAIWGLGKAGLGSFEQLLPFLDVTNEDQRIHAAASFGSELPTHVIRALVRSLSTNENSDIKKQTVSVILSGSEQHDILVPLLVKLAMGINRSGRMWARTILGSMNPNEIDSRIADRELAEAIFPLQQLTPNLNWAKTAKNQEALAFVRKQNVY